MSLTAVSLFAGVGGFDLAMQRNGINVVAAVEIDPKARAVLARRFPETALFPDVTKVTADELRDAGFVPDRGIVTGGFPCQPFSVAGARKGTDDSRGTLFWQIMRLVEELRPAYLLLENVPGLLSINEGETLREMLDLINETGYLVDLDILDAQFFGVPQRRRRVFIRCQRADLGLNGRTTTSALTTLTMTIEALALLLTGHAPASITAATSWDFSSATYADGLTKRMRLLSPGLDSEALATLLGTSADRLALSVSERASSESVTANPEAEATGTATSSSDSTGLGVSTPTVSQWRSISDALCDRVRSSTTSTASSPTTASTISTCAQALLTTAALIIRSTPSSPNYWHAASSASTVLEVFTSYARQAGNDLFGDLDWSYDWDAFCREADGLIVAGRRAGAPDIAGPVQVLLEPESVRGDFAPGVAAGQDVAGTLGGGAGSRGWSDDTDRMTFVPVPASLSTRERERDAGRGEHRDDRNRTPHGPRDRISGGDPMNTIPASLYHHGTVVNQDVDAGHLVVIDE